MGKEWRISIASPPDREKPVAEIFYANIQWAELNQEGLELSLEIYPQPDGRPWRVSYAEVVEILQEARRQLLQRQ